MGQKETVGALRKRLEGRTWGWGAGKGLVREKA